MNQPSLHLIEAEPGIPGRANRNSELWCRSLSKLTSRRQMGKLCFSPRADDRFRQLFRFPNEGEGSRQSRIVPACGICHRPVRSSQEDTPTLRLVQSDHINLDTLTCGSSRCILPTVLSHTPRSRDPCITAPADAAPPPPQPRNVNKSKSGGGGLNNPHHDLRSRPKRLQRLQPTRAQSPPPYISLRGEGTVRFMVWSPHRRPLTTYIHLGSRTALRCATRRRDGNGDWDGAQKLRRVCESCQ